MKKYTLILILVSIFIILDSQGFSQGCSQCKLVAEQGAEADENSFGSNINSGILYLMAMPYIFLVIVFRKKIFNFFRSKSA